MINTCNYYLATISAKVAELYGHDVAFEDAVKSLANKKFCVTKVVVDNDGVGFLPYSEKFEGSHAVFDALKYAKQFFNNEIVEVEKFVAFRSVYAGKGRDRVFESKTLHIFVDIGYRNSQRFVKNTSDEVKKLMKPDDLLQCSIYSHGLMAYRVDNILKAVENLETLENIKGELACSWKTQRIGKFGVFVSGEVTLASNLDLYSQIEENGERSFNTADEVTAGIISEKEQFKPSMGWKNKNSEFFIKHPRIRGIWIKRRFLEEMEEENQKFYDVFTDSLRLYALEKGVKVFVI